MARRLTTQDFEMKLHDNLTDTDIVLKYRMPTTKEREGYHNATFQRVRNDTKFHFASARHKYGLLILTGIRDGDFEIEKDGAFVPISSDPKSQNYVENWKDLIAESASDIIQALSVLIFDNSVEAGKATAGSENENP